MMPANAPGLLVSVRSAAEARAALAGGAHLIDVKEPARGALGRANDPTIARVVRAVAGRRPVSAALGELCQASPCLITGLSFAKWGLAGLDSADWPARLLDAIAERRRADPHCRAVAVAYADWRRAGAPRPEAVAAFAHRHGTALLVDTAVKDGSRLLDWLPPQRIARLVRDCRRAQVPIALAGSLDGDAIALLAEPPPTWFAVRGAACQAGRRDQLIDPERVRRLARQVEAIGFARCTRGATPMRRT